MRILIVNNFAYVTGGADRHCLDLAHILRRAGHEVRFLSTLAPQNVESAGAFVPLRVTNATRDDISAVDRIEVAARAVWNRSAWGAMARLLEEFRPDVAHVHKIYPQLSVAGLRAATAARVPIVQTLHDYEFISASAADATGGRLDRHESRLQYRLLNTALHQVKRRWHVPAVSAWVAVSRTLAATYAGRGILATPIPNFTLEIADVVPAFAERRGIFYAGRLTRSKGVEDVLEMARALPHTPVRIAGHGALAEKVAAAASDLDNLEYLGSLTRGEVQAQLRAARICVMPSRWEEPAGLVCLEAMAVGTPVVAYRVGGLAEYVKDAGAGIVVDKNPGALAAACRTLAVDRSVWEDLSNSGVAASRETHSADAYLERILEIYERLAA